MDIRTKLALALVSISLVSMLLLGTFAYQTASELLRQVSERQLDALAESKQRDLTKVIEGWKDRVQLIRSRTRLRTLLSGWERGENASVYVEVRRIVEDAVESVENLERVDLFDADGALVTSVGAMGPDVQVDPLVFVDPDSVHYVETLLPEDGRVLVRFDAALVLEGSVVGAVATIIDAAELLTVTRNYTGLGEFGESLVVMAGRDDASGLAIVLAPLRHDPQLRDFRLDDSPYLAAALAGQETVFRTGVSDYRGADVWCATRTLPEVNWGLVVKIDSAEESQRAEWLREQMVDLGLALGALAILGGSLLGFRLGRPIRELKDVVERIRAGERDLRADASSADEVGFLADALNDLLDEQPP